MRFSPSIALRTAYLCLDCQIINQGAHQGRCHSCGSDNTYPLSALLTAYIKPEPPLRRPPRQPGYIALLGAEVTLKSPSSTNQPLEAST
jgi:hypothetical protein